MSKSEMVSGECAKRIILLFQFLQPLDICLAKIIFQSLRPVVFSTVSQVSEAVMTRPSLLPTTCTHAHYL